MNTTEKIKSFYNSVNYTPGFKSKGSKEIKYILECESGSIYYLGKFPQEFENIKNEKEVDVERTLLFKKVKTFSLVTHAQPQKAPPEFGISKKLDY